MVPPLAAVIGLLAIRSQRLWHAPRIAIRSTELAGLAKAAAITGAGVLLADRVLGLYALGRRWSPRPAPLAWTLLVAWRSVYRSWLAMERSAGRYVQRTIVVGTGREALEIVRLAEIHPEAGSLVVGIVGNRRRGRRRRPRPTSGSARSPTCRPSSPPTRSPASPSAPPTSPRRRWPS